MSFTPGNHTVTKSIGWQLWSMRRLCPQFRFYRSKKGFVWTGRLKPRKQSPDYLIKIVYRLPHHPRVYVIQPQIVRDVIHIYQSDRSLCLYHPKDGDWTPAKYIAKTIIPWTVEWLLYYEIWCSTGVWFGPEAPHTSRK